MFTCDNYVGPSTVVVFYNSFWHNRPNLDTKFEIKEKTYLRNWHYFNYVV